MSTTSLALVQALGHSIAEKSLSISMKELRLDARPSTKGCHDASGRVYQVRSTNRTKDVTLTFDGARRYRLEFGEPLSKLGVGDDELILVEIDFEDQGKQLTYDLPFTLCFRDDQQTILTKLGKRPYERDSDVSYGHAWWFGFDEYRLLTALDHNHRLLFLRFMRIDLAERELLRLKAHLKAQNVNIRKENAKAVAAFANKLPTKTWERRMNDGDDAFTQTGIDAFRAVLDEYIVTLGQRTEKNNATPIYNSVKKLVIALNALNVKHHSMIETMEREELADYINSVVRATGLEVPSDVDLTEPWRHW